MDDTLVLKECLASEGGLAAFLGRGATSVGMAFNIIEPVLPKVHHSIHFLLVGEVDSVTSCLFSLRCCHPPSSG